MGQRDYPKMLLERIELTFTEWKKEKFITEHELYRFLHTLKGTSGTIGLHALSDYCSSQLEVLSSESEREIPVLSLVRLGERIKGYLDATVEDSKVLLPEIYRNQFDEETYVLIIDDDLEFVTYMKELLEAMGAHVIIALNGKQGMEQFYSMRPNFVLIGLMLPDMCGFEILDQIKDTANARQVTMMITSVDQSRENRIQAYQRGAMDFIKKPIDTELFISYMFNREGIRKTVGKSTLTDGLTGVGNRRHFDDRIHYLVETYNRSGLTFSCVILDLDLFKQVNDLYGHPTGDEVLRKLGEIMMMEKRTTDEVFRYGGEEFAFLLSDAIEEDSLTFVERVRKKFNAVVFEKDNYPFSVTFSAGIATYNGDLVNLISSADQALYEAKRSGRNRTVVYDKNIGNRKRKLTIIIVDDDDVVRKVLHEKLREWTLPDIEITVHVYSDGPSFLNADWYSLDEFYIVLLDGVMPGMDGLEVLSRLKRDITEKNVLVSMMTARTGESDIKAALWLGADDYLMKPFKANEVMSRIQQLMNRLFN